MKTKICVLCEQEKPLEEFESDKRRTDSKGKRCKACKNEIAKKSWHKNRPARLEYARRYNKENSEKIRQQVTDRRRQVIYEAMVLICGGGPFCQCCSETTVEFLTFDHINNDGGEFRKKTNSTAGLARYILKHKPTDIQILCANCHLSKTRFGICLHSRHSVLSGRD